MSEEEFYQCSSSSLPSLTDLLCLIALLFQNQVVVMPLTNGFYLTYEL